MKIYRFLLLSISSFRSQKVSGNEKQKKQVFEQIVATVNNCFNENFSEETSP